MHVDSSTAAAQQQAVQAAKHAHEQQQVEGEAAVDLIEAAGAVAPVPVDPALGSQIDLTG